MSDSREQGPAVADARRAAHRLDAERGRRAEVERRALSGSLKVEHARYVGRMHWLGFNTQRITSVRAGLQ